MAIRTVIMVLLAAFSTMGNLQAATFRTKNFIVEAPRQVDAEEFGQLAEHFRKVKAQEWLGQEMPDWPQPCPLKVIITPAGASGVTSFTFGRVIYQEMEIQGQRERLKNSVLPHEITHTVFAHHFRQPVPRWADEGGSVYSEDELERTRHDRLCRDILNSGKGIQLRALFPMKEYPRDMMTLYAQGYSVTKFLVEQSNRQTFLNFVAYGLTENWDDACQKYYSFRNVPDLESAWIKHLKDVARGTAVVREQPSGPRTAPEGFSKVGGSSVTRVYDSLPPSAPLFDPIPLVRGSSDHLSSPGPHDKDIGWTRPRSIGEPPAPRANQRIEPASWNRSELPTPPTGYRPAPVGFDARSNSPAAQAPYRPAATLLPPVPEPFRK
ncbi:MAG: hypothetical protein R3B84_22205 [Zavarzinella sp.]